MGVYIKGVTKSQLMKVIINSTEFMPDDFEVIEVKTPHGRLIDAEEAEEVMLDVMCGTGYQTQAMDVVRSDFYTSTIIEAEAE